MLAAFSLAATNGILSNPHQLTLVSLEMFHFYYRYYATTSRRRIALALLLLRENKITRIADVQLTLSHHLLLFMVGCQQVDHVDWLLSVFPHLASSAAQVAARDGHPAMLGAIIKHQRGCARSKTLRQVGRNAIDAGNQRALAFVLGHGYCEPKFYRVAVHRRKAEALRQLLAHQAYPSSEPCLWLELDQCSCVAQEEIASVLDEFRVHCYHDHEREETSELIERLLYDI